MALKFRFAGIVFWTPEICNFFVHGVGNTKPVITSVCAKARVVSRSKLSIANPVLCGYIMQSGDKKVCLGVFVGKQRSCEGQCILNVRFVKICCPIGNSPSSPGREDNHIAGSVKQRETKNSGVSVTRVPLSVFTMASSGVTMGDLQTQLPSQSTQLSMPRMSASDVTKLKQGLISNSNFTPVLWPRQPRLVMTVDPEPFELTVE